MVPIYLEVGPGQDQPEKKVDKMQAVCRVTMFMCQDHNVGK